MRSLLIIIIALGTAPWMNAATATGGLVVSVSGEVTLTDRAGKTSTANVGTPIEVGQQLITGANGEVSVALHKGLAITLKSGSAARLAIWKAPADEAPDQLREATLELDEGRMVVLVQEEEMDRIRFRIKTPKGIATPRGNFYAIQVIEGEAFLAVKEGKVGLDQFIPLEYEEPEAVPSSTPAVQERYYGRTTTTSPRG